jgi:DNA-binding PadR family transcriptional regulator
MRHRHWHHRKHRKSHGWHRFGPWSLEGKFFERGEIRLALLSLLNDGPRHGYELMTAIEERSDGHHRPSAGTIYPTLQQLQEEELVISQEIEGGKRLYELTDQGRALLEDEAPRVEEIWNRSQDEEWGGWGDAMLPGAAEIVKPAFRLMRTAVRATARSRDPERREKVRAILVEAAEKIRSLNGDARDDHAE